MTNNTTPSPSRPMGRPKNSPLKGWSGDALIVYRIKAGISTQAIFGALLGVSRQAVQRWESGNQSPSQAQVVMISEVLKISPRKLGKAPRGCEARAILMTIKVLRGVK